MKKARDFTNLLIWQKAHVFVLHVYAYTSKFPKAELYGLTSQVRRAVISVELNSEADKVARLLTSCIEAIKRQKRGGGREKRE